MPEDAEVEKLANTLKKHGMAVSHMDAINRAKDILGLSNKGTSLRASGPTPEERKSEKNEVFLDRLGRKAEKVDVVIKEVEKEVKESKPEQHEHTKHDFNAPDFDITKEDVKLGELVSEAEEPAQQQEVMTNNEIILNKEKEAETLEKQGFSGPHLAEIEEKGVIDKDDDEEPIIEETQNVQPIEHSTVIEAKEEKKPEKKKAELTKQEKDMSDLTKLFNFGK